MLLYFYIYNCLPWLFLSELIVLCFVITETEKGHPWHASLDPRHRITYDALNLPFDDVRFFIYIFARFYIYIHTYLIIFMFLWFFLWNACVIFISVFMSRCADVFCVLCYVCVMCYVCMVKSLFTLQVPKRNKSSLRNRTTCHYNTLINILIDVIER